MLLKVLTYNHIHIMYCLCLLISPANKVSIMNMNDVCIHTKINYLK